MQVIHERRDLLQKAKEDMRLDRFQKKYAKVETVKADIYATNDKDIGNS